ncbi:MAG: preprotein translocase subunit SecG [Pirellulales bacterium]
MGPLFMILMFFTGLFLIVLVLLQRGRGGGLAGALGGMGGQSAFGAKAGDVFTRITAAVAVFWILLCVGAVKYFGAESDAFDEGLGGGVVEQPLDDAALPRDAAGRSRGGEGGAKAGTGGASGTKAGGAKGASSTKAATGSPNGATGDRGVEAETEPPASREKASGSSAEK